jgi:hypothetical protein
MPKISRPASRRREVEDDKPRKRSVRDEEEDDDDELDEELEENEDEDYEDEDEEEEKPRKKSKPVSKKPSSKKPAKATTSVKKKEITGSGWGKVANKKIANDKQQEEIKKGRVAEFWLKDGEEAQIQWLHNDPYCTEVHNIPFYTKNGKKYYKAVYCQLSSQKHCMMCQDGDKPSWKAVFTIIDKRGEWDKEKKRFKKGSKPQEKVWAVSNTVALQIKQIMDKKGDLTKLVYNVSRTGSGAKDTAYTFEQARDEDDRRIPPIKWTPKLPALEELCKPPTDDELVSRGYGESGSADDDEELDDEEIDDWED